MRAVLLASVLALASPSVDAGGPNTFTFLALEPPAVHLAGGYQIRLQPSAGERHDLLDQALALHLQDPLRGAPDSRRAAPPPGGPGPSFLAVVAGPGSRAVVGGLAAAPSAPSAPIAQQLVVSVTLEDPEFWEAWTVDQAQPEGQVGSWSFCLSREATLRAQLLVQDGVSGRVLEQAPLIYVEAASDCGATREDAAQRVTPEDALAEFAVDGLARSVADRVSPRWVAVEARLVRKGPSARGHKVLRSGDLAAATRWFVDASARDPEDVWLRYHAAVLLTAGFHFGAARDHLAGARARADELLFAEWEEEIHRRERAALMLRRMGVPQEPIRF